MSEVVVTPYWQSIMDAPRTDADRRDELIGSVEYGLKERYYGANATSLTAAAAHLMTGRNRP